MQQKLPIATLRRAVSWMAWESAENEGYDKPHPRHNEQIFWLLKQMRDLDPEITRRAILLAVSGIDLKNKLWSEKTKLSQQVVSELAHDIKKHLNSVLRKHFKQGDNINDWDEIIINIIKDNLDKKLAEFKEQDPRYEEIFKWNEELFDAFKDLIEEGLNLVME